MTTPQQGASELTRELLPCPFCGSRAIPHRLVDTAHVIECVECGARGAESGPGHVAKTEREAAALWNRRTTAVAPAVAEPVECEHSPETGRTLPDGGYEWKCDLCGEVLYRATPIKPPAPEPVRCSHEAYQGECVHCGVPFVGGRPKYPPQLAAPPERTAQPTEERTDSDRLDDIQSEYLHVVPFDMPTGQGDADVGWEIRQSTGKEDVTLVRHYHDDLRAALDEFFESSEKPLPPKLSVAAQPTGASPTTNSPAIDSSLVVGASEAVAWIEWNGQDETPFREAVLNYGMRCIFSARAQTHQQNEWKSNAFEKVIYELRKLTAQPNWREPLEALVKHWKRERMPKYPTQEDYLAGQLDCADELRALIDKLAAQQKGE
jgi:Lar family restriction alleviation protein